ncbi:unnamed protein product [Prunus brigantina]
MGERGTPLSAGEPTQDEIGTLLERQLLLTALEKVGVVIWAFVVSDRFVGFIYGLAVKVLMPQEDNRDSFIKNFSSLLKGKEDAFAELEADTNMRVKPIGTLARQSLSPLSPSRGSSCLSPSDGPWRRV